jgi:U3 small nucleolar RNA-associated protein 19
LATEGRGSGVLQTFISNALSVLSSTCTVPSSGNDTDKFYVNPPANSKNQLYSINAYKKQAQRAWLALFKLGLSKEQRKIVLSMVSSRIAPCFVKVELLMDFLIDSLNSGGSTSLLALSGLFHLIQEKNLDYPMFYPKLYSMLDVGVLHSRHRSRFFRLLDIFLASTHLPAALVASFIKKLSRLSLQAPPSAIVVVVPWIYNLLKRHPTCTFMVHRAVQGEGKIEELKNKGMNDPFNMNEEDPMKTDAIYSSLWEVQMLQAHYHPNVATLARIISEQFTKHAYNMEDFLDHSYSTVSILPGYPSQENLHSNSQ